MEKYEPLSFYDNYFKQVEGIKLVHGFEEKKTKDGNIFFVGKFSVDNAIHKIVIEAEIPVTFPHKKLTFYTDSLYGYPHLIPEYTQPKEGFRSWFCLNSPFAETAKGQLDVEIERLKGWLDKNLSKDVPAIIKDPKVTNALQKMQAYSWENTDILSRIKDDVVISFIGDFAQNAEYFNVKVYGDKTYSYFKRKGYLNAIQNGSNRFFVTREKMLSNARIPYIIVDEEPAKEALSDFVALRKLYNWDKDTCEHLLPKFDSYEEKWELARYHYPSDSYGKTQQEIWDVFHKATDGVEYPEAYASLVQERIQKITEELKKGTYNHNPFDCPILYYDKKADETVEEYAERLKELKAEEKRMDEMETARFKPSFFFFGVRKDKTISWYPLYTNGQLQQSQEKKIDLGIEEIILRKITRRPLYLEPFVVITHRDYFGRGAFTEKFASRKIAIIGIGAIGSQVAETMARSGVKHLGLWDNDVVESGNICRAAFTQQDLGESKVFALRRHLLAISPEVEVTTHGYWRSDDLYNLSVHFTGGDLYGAINYDSQETVQKQLAGYDMIIDCTGSNEVLHFLSYTMMEKALFSLCITNHANDLLLMSNADGNVFELRKHYLSKIEQDTQNFFLEGSGCYSPTFRARNCDIACLVNLAVRHIADSTDNGHQVVSTTWSYTRRGIVADRLKTYKLQDSNIRLTISSEVLLDMEDMEDVPQGATGYFLGGYSHDGKLVMITHAVEACKAHAKLTGAFNTSAGIIDYLGDFYLAYDEDGHCKPEYYDQIRRKAADSEININNPLLAVRTPGSSIKFFLYIDNAFKEFVPVNV